MIFSSDDKERVTAFYNNLIFENGLNTPQALGWNNQYSQQSRFFVLSQMTNLDHKTILDVGCGFADLYPFLSDRYTNFRYVGLDIVPSMIQRAKLNYPHIEFLESDFSRYVGDAFDVMFASGSFALKIPHYTAVYFGMIQKMFEKTNVAVGFNMLNSKYHPNDDKFATYSVPEVYEFCSQMTDKIIIHQNYLPYDFTVYLYH